MPSDGVGERLMPLPPPNNSPSDNANYNSSLSHLDLLLIVVLLLRLYLILAKYLKWLVLCPSTNNNILLYPWKMASGKITCKALLSTISFIHITWFIRSILYKYYLHIWCASYDWIKECWVSCEKDIVSDTAIDICF